MTDPGNRPHMTKGSTMVQEKFDRAYAWFIAHLVALRAESEDERDRGAVSMETAVIWGIVLVIAVGAGLLLKDWVFGKVNDVVLQ